MLKLIPILIISVILSAPITTDQSNRVAENIFIEFSGQSIDRYIVDYVNVINENNQNLIYAYHLLPHGYILVSADDKTSPVIGYSFNNNLSLQNIPDNFSFVLNYFRLYLSGVYF